MSFVSRDLTTLSERELKVADVFRVRVIVDLFVSSLSERFVLTLIKRPCTSDVTNKDQKRLVSNFVSSLYSRRLGQGCDDVLRLSQ